MDSGPPDGVPLRLQSAAGSTCTSSLYATNHYHGGVCIQVQVPSFIYGRQLRLPEWPLPFGHARP